MSTEQAYAPRGEERRELWSMKMSPRVKYLATLAARARGVTLSALVEAALEREFKEVTIEDQRDSAGSRNLAELGDTFYAPTEADRFLSLVGVAPWLSADADMTLLRILRHSPYYGPKGVLHAGRIRHDWETLSAIRHGQLGIDILPPDHQPPAALLFGLMGDRERTELYRVDPDRFKQESAAYHKAMKARKL